MQSIRAKLIALIVSAAALVMLMIGSRSLLGGNSAGGYSLLKYDEAALRYPYTQLDERGKALYSTLLGGIRDHADWIKLPDTYTDEEYERIYLMVGMQEPELFALDDTYELAEQMNEVHIRYAYDAQTTTEMQQRMDEAAERILSHISPAQTENQQLLMLHDLLAAQTEYVETKHSGTAYGALAEGMAQCEGYAKAYVYLARKIGLNVMNVSGTSGTTPHVWNVAKIGTGYYNIDVTWDDSESFRGQTAHSYFAMPDGLWTEHHADTDVFTPPACVGKSETYYHTHGLLLNDVTQLPDKLNAWIGMYPLCEFQCTSDALYSQIVSEIRSDPDIIAQITDRIGGSWSYICDKERRVMVILT